MRLGNVKARLAQKLTMAIPNVEFAVDGHNRELYETLSHPLVCISLNRISAKEFSLGGYAGETQGRLSQGRKAELAIGFTVYCGGAEGSAVCGDIFDRLCEALLFDKEISVSEVSCGETDYIEKYEVFCLRAQAGSHVFLTKETSSEAAYDFRLAVKPLHTQGKEPQSDPPNI